MRIWGSEHGHRFEVYTLDDLGEESADHHINKALDLWRRLSEAFDMEHPPSEREQAVMDKAAVWVWHSSDDTRPYYRFVLFHALNVYQYSDAPRYVAKSVVEYLQAQGIEAHYSSDVDAMASPFEDMSIIWWSKPEGAPTQPWEGEADAEAL